MTGQLGRPVPAGTRYRFVYREPRVVHITLSGDTVCQRTVQYSHPIQHAIPQLPVNRTSVASLSGAVSPANSSTGGVQPRFDPSVQLHRTADYLHHLCEWSAVTDEVLFDAVQSHVQQDDIDVSHRLQHISHLLTPLVEVSQLDLCADKCEAADSERRQALYENIRAELSGVVADVPVPYVMPHMVTDNTYAMLDHT